MGHPDRFRGAGQTPGAQKLEKNMIVIPAHALFYSNRWSTIYTTVQDLLKALPDVRSNLGRTLDMARESKVVRPSHPRRAVSGVK
jgi:hypothetical protein